MYEYDVVVVHVVDGDTVDVDIDLGFGVWLRDQRIRLYGIDTPESRTRDLEEKVFGNLAKEYLIDNLMKDKYSYILLKTYKDSRGKFGRILGELIVVDDDEEKINLNQKMVDMHYAVQYFGQSKDLIEEQHIKNREYLYETGVVERS